MFRPGIYKHKIQQFKFFIIYLVTLKLCVVQLLQSIFHVFSSQIFHDTRAIFKHIRVTNISGLPHVILEVLPTSRGRKTRHHDPVLTPPGRRTSASSRSSRSSSSETSSSSLGKLNPQSVPIIIVSISGVNSIFRISKNKTRFRIDKVKPWNGL